MKNEQQQKIKNLKQTEMISPFEVTIRRDVSCRADKSTHQAQSALCEAGREAPPPV